MEHDPSSVHHTRHYSVETIFIGVIKSAQRVGEAFDSFATDLKILVKNCEYGELTESTIKDRIVEGFNNHNTRERLLRGKDLPLQKAVDICKAVEVVRQHMKTLLDSIVHEAHTISKKQEA